MLFNTRSVGRLVYSGLVAAALCLVYSSTANKPQESPKCHKPQKPPKFVVEYSTEATDYGTILITNEGDFEAKPDGGWVIRSYEGVLLIVSEHPLHNGLLYYSGTLDFDANDNGTFIISLRQVIGTYQYDEQGNLVYGEDGLPVLTPTGAIWKGTSIATYENDNWDARTAYVGVAGSVTGLYRIAFDGGARSTQDIEPTTAYEKVFSVREK
jgi:hypothetical protein